MSEKRIGSPCKKVSVSSMNEVDWTAKDQDLCGVEKQRRELEKHLSKFSTSMIMDLMYSRISGSSNLPVLQEISNNCLKRVSVLHRAEYDELRAGLVQKVHSEFQSPKRLRLEDRHSSYYPSKALKPLSLLQPEDRSWRYALLRSAKIDLLKLPPFEMLNNSTVTNKSVMPTEFDCEFHFSFGFDCAFFANLLNKVFLKKVKKERLPMDLCGIISEMLGNTKFIVNLKVYFDKQKREDWYEQDGEAWIFYPIGKSERRRDLVSFDQNERIYYVEEWPASTGLLQGDYDDAKTAQRMLSEEVTTEKLERTLVAWLCSQISFFTFSKMRRLQNGHVRAYMNKLLFVLKGWFTGLLLGESFEPPKTWGSHSGSRHR